MGPTTSGRSPDRRRRALIGFGAAVTFVLAAQVPQAVTSAQTPPPADVGTPAARRAAAAPRVLASSFHGGLEWDEGSDVEVDRAGSSYLTGFTLSPDLPVPGAAQGALAGLADGFVTKVAADGRRLLWSTYLGGVDIDVPNSLAMDEQGNVYVTGRTGSPDFPTTEAAFQPQLRGTACQGEPCHDAFVTKIDPSGRVVFSTLFGGTANEEGVSIAVDRAGRAWITGNTDSADLPVRRAVQETFQSPPCPGDLPCEYDVFVAALAPDGSRLSFASYLGGDAGDTAGGIAVDAGGSAYVTGTTRSTDFPVTDGALQPSINGLECGPPPGAPCLDAFVTKITDRRLAYSTYLGGSGDERSGGIAVDGKGQAVVTGTTRSPDLPVNSAAQAGLDNASCTGELPEEQCDDAFVSQLGANGRGLVFSTYLGGQAEDQGLAVTVDTPGNVYVAGRTDSRDFPVLRAVQPGFGGYIDGFATKLARRSGALLWSTFVGGDEADRTTGIDTHRAGGVHLTGRTLSPDFPVVDAFQPTLAKDDDYDAYLHVLK
jgi:hypothetical protein